jgi:hypothetical protein
MDEPFVRSTFYAMNAKTAVFGWMLRVFQFIKVILGPIFTINAKMPEDLAACSSVSD